MKILFDFQPQEESKPAPIDSLLTLDNGYDNGALNGLKGWFAFHIMMHNIWISNPQLESPNSAINLYGGVSMPIILLLAGFCHTLSYGRVKWSSFNNLNEINSIGDFESSPIQRKPRRIFDAISFYRKRLFKTFPVHWLGIFLSLILWKFRYEWPKL